MNRPALLKEQKQVLADVIAFMEGLLVLSTLAAPDKEARKVAKKLDALRAIKTRLELPKPGPSW